MSLAQLFYLKETFRENLWRLRRTLFVKRQAADGWPSARFADSARRALSPRPSVLNPGPFTLESLEPRLLLSATPMELNEAQSIEPAAVTVSHALLPSLDVNLDGQATPQDAIVILRYLSLVSGPALTAGVVTGGERTDPAAIKAYLDQMTPAMLDVNLDGQATPQDAIVILRYLSLVSGPALTAGVVTSGMRTNPAAIGSFLDDVNPTRERVVPLVTAGLQRDTGISTTDGITNSATIIGTIADINPIVSFNAGFDATSVANFTDVLTDLLPDGTFQLSVVRLAQLAGGTLSDGAYTLHLRITDANGNLTTVDRTFTLDRISPVLTAVQLASESDSVPQGDNRTVFASVNLNGQTEPDVQVTLIQTGATTAADNTGLFRFESVPLAGGANELVMQAVDRAGNLSLASQTVTREVAEGGVFTDEVLATELDLPTVIKFLPDGRLLLGELTGTIKIFSPPYTQPDLTPFLQLTNVGTAGSGQGLFDFVLDPNFSTNHYYYVFYTLGSPNFDRLSRFTANATLTGTVPGSELVLYQDPEASGIDHHGGAIVFGSDGKLYFTTGEHFDSGASQDLSSPRGKLHRINPDGTVPTDNPFYDGNGTNWDSLWAIGLRNPYRAYYDAPTQRFFIGDVGGNDNATAIEEVNLTVRGANYGWPNDEGNSTNPAYTNPIYTYAHNGRDAAITSGFVYHGTQFPSSYQGSYFFADYTQNWIKRLTFDANGNVTSAVNFVPADGSADGPYGDIVYLTEGPEGALYFADLGFTESSSTFGVGKLRRIQYVQSNLPSVVAAAATPVGGTGTLTFDFSSAGSFDPEGQPLTYLWTFGDGQTSALANPRHTYMNPGTYQVRLTVSDGGNTTLSAPLQINAGNRPIVTLTSTPSDGGLFRAGDTITYSATAMDIEDGVLSASAFTWAIDFLHEGHVHPGLPIAGVAGGFFQIPTSGHDFSGLTRYRIAVIVTDSDGLQTTHLSFVFPDKVNLTFDTTPSALTVYVDGIAHTASFVYDTLIGFTHTIDARNQADTTNSYTFQSWSDGGTQSHQIIVPAADQSYAASYQSTPVSLVALDLPSERLWDLGDGGGSAQPGDVLTRLDDLRQRGRFKDLTGAGMTAVVIDTDIDVNHPFFGPDADHNGIADRIVYQWDFADNDADVSDRNGHGSHIASLIGSQDLMYPGVAPETDLIALKVFKDSGTGAFAEIERALQWVIAHVDDYGIDVVNLSLGDGRNWTVPGAQYGVGNEFAALNEAGVLLIAAAGNNFFTAKSQPGVAYPAADPNVIGVGAVWTADFGGLWCWSSGAMDLTSGPDRIASFSQRDLFMTEVFAPGVRLTGANQLGGTATMQGTSQAAAYLSGTALLAQQFAEKNLGRKLTPEEFVDLVTATSKRIPDGDDEDDNVTNSGDTFARADVLQLVKGIHRYSAWERGEGKLHHGNKEWAIAFAQRGWVEEFVSNGASQAEDDEEQLLIALPR